MANCGLCSAKKGKRYCSPIDKVICPICCAESRLTKIDCNQDCRFLEGVLFQEKRTEDKKFSVLMNSVGHGQFDDIFQQTPVVSIAFEIESLVRDIYVEGEIRTTDTIVYEAYNAVYRIHFQDKQIEEGQLDELTKKLLEQYETNSPEWRTNIDEEIIGQLYLRLMISVKNMRGGIWGEFGYLNYLKNNFGQSNLDREFIAEDKFGRKSIHKLDNG